MKNILFLGCHCDDIELGCGASINKLKSTATIDCVVLCQKSIDNVNLKKIAQKSLKMLGASNVYFFDFKPSFFYKKTQKLWKTLKSFDIEKYDSVFTQEPDFHQDHSSLYKATNRLFRGKNIISYSSSMISCPFFQANYFVQVTKSDLSNKILALMNYKIYRNKPYFSEDIIKSYAIINGALANCKYAEGFSIKRLIV